MDVEKLHSMTPRKKNLHVRNPGHGRVNTKLATRFREYFYIFLFLKILLRVTMYKAPGGAWMLKIQSRFNIN
jgi:hypothetical protein